MEIYVKLFDKKFNVNVTNKVFRETMLAQKAFAEMNNTAEKSDAEIFDTSIAANKQAVNYLKDTLKLTKKQTDALDNMDFDETMSTANYVCYRAMGMSDEQIEAEKEKVAEDPKK